ncbi:MAG: Gfo/Idh/MocA family oxidoreductase [Deltaproteobacteria bacterium]|nr:Gfo/Idh/MocA family oxidoreductase [Deltaproteobacteria bacterium]
MKILVVGCGSIGRRHLDNLVALGEADILVHDIDEERLAGIQMVYPDVVTSSDIEELWTLDPSVAVITSPTNLHLEHALDAAARGCDLLIEKPLADSADGLDELERLVVQNELVTMVACNMRFHWGLRAVKRLLDQGDIGRIVSARIEAGQYLPDWHPQEDYRCMYSARRSAGGGVLLDSIHELDYAMWFFGDVTEIKSMHGHLSSLEIDTEDVGDMLLRFRDGPIVNVHVDYVQRAYSRSCKIIGELGTIFWDIGARSVRIYRSVSGRWATHRQPSEYSIGQMYVDEMRYFLGCVRRREQTFNDVGRARETLRVALAAKGEVSI